MIIGTATNGGWFSGISKKVSQYIKVEPIDPTPAAVSPAGQAVQPQIPPPAPCSRMGIIKDVAKRALPVIQ